MVKKIICVFVEIFSINFGGGGVWYLTAISCMSHCGFSCGPCIFQQPEPGIAACYYVILRHLFSNKLPWMPWSVNVESKWQMYVCLFTPYTTLVGLTLKPCILSMFCNYKYVFLVILKINSYCFLCGTHWLVLIVGHCVLCEVRTDSLYIIRIFVNLKG